MDTPREFLYAEIPLHALEALAGDFAAVGGYLGQATLEAASALGDEELVLTVESNLNEHGWPHADDLKRLEAMQPGIVGAILDRSEEIQAERHAEELREARKPKNILKGMLKGMRYLRF